MVLLVDTPAKPESPSKSESVPGSPNQELLRRLSYLSRGDDSGAEDGAEEEAVVEEYSSTEEKEERFAVFKKNLKLIHVGQKSFNANFRSEGFEKVKQGG